MHTLAMLIAVTTLSEGSTPHPDESAAVPVAAAPATLPVNSEVLVRINEPLNSSTARKGRRFDVSVSRDVLVGNTVVIPRGTPGTGEVTWRTGKGAFGKSGKMEIAVTSLVLNGRSVPVSGKTRLDGRGGTGATLGAIFAGGLVASVFVTGRSARFEQGHEWRAFTTEAVALGGVGPVPVAIAAYVPRAAAPGYAPPVAEVRISHAQPLVPMLRADRATGDAYAARLAAAQGVRRYEPRQGWTISD